MRTLEIRLLGPVEVHLDGHLECMGPKEKVLLGVLALTPNRAISTNCLMDAIWNGDPPRSGLDTLQSMVSRLRSRLGPERIESINHSYRLSVGPEHVDALEFEDVAKVAASLLTEDQAAAAQLARDALALWRGTPFGDLCDLTYFEPEIRRLESLRLGTIELLLEVDVACGCFTAAIPALEAAIVESPYRERLWYLLVLALARDGRRVDAIRACQQLHGDLVDIGLEPSSDIRELEQMVLSEAPAVRSQLRR
jgi:DNA-binding SARP family transcriptional activator